MSKIQELLNDKNSVIAFDIDGVLATMEWGEYNHFGQDDDEWSKMYEDEGVNYYTEKAVCKRMQRFLEGKDKSKMYVITKAYNDNEGKDKTNFAYNFYGIPRENVFYVDSNIGKVDYLIEIKSRHPEVDDHHVIIVDDTVEVLSAVMLKTGFTTVHISSFLDM